MDGYKETVLWTQLDSCTHEFKAVVTHAQFQEFQVKSIWATQMVFCFILFLKDNTKLVGIKVGVNLARDQNPSYEILRLTKENIKNKNRKQLTIAKPQLV